MYRMEGPVTTPELWLGWALPGGYRPDSVMQEFVSAVVNGALGEAVAEDHDIADVGASAVPGTQATMLICQVRLRAGKNPEKSAQHVLNQLYKMWVPGSATEDKMSAIVFGKLRIIAATAMALGSESVFQRAALAASSAHFNSDPSFYKRTLQAIVDMPEERVTQYAYKYLTRDRARVLYVTPLPATARAPGAMTGVGKSTDDDAESRSPNYDPQVVHKYAKAPGTGQWKTTKLKNGLELVIARHTAIPAVAVDLTFHGGRASADVGVAELASLVVRPLSKRHGQLSDYGAQVRRGVGDDAWQITVRAGAGNLANVLAILGDQIRSLAVPSGAIDDVRKYLFPVFRKDEQRPEEKADRAFWKGLYEDHPYGRRATVDDLDKLDAAAINKWVARVVNPKNATLAVVGDVDPDEVVKLAEQWLGDWNPPGAEIPPLDPPARSSVSVSFSDKTQLKTPAGPPKVLVTHRPGATQGELTLGCLLPAADPRSAVMYDLMASMVADHLFKTVRGKLGASYGMRGRAQTLRGGASHMLITGNINNGSLAPALQAIKEYWDGLPQGNFSDKEMNRIRWDMALRYNLDFTTNAQIGDQIIGTRNVNWQLSTLDRYGDDLASISKADLTRAFQVCHDSQVLSIVGDDTVVSAALKQSWK
jgi:zinc protease